jgi:hypothetical protein
MRQPQSVIACSPTIVAVSSTAEAPSVKPARVPNSRKLPKNPRRRSGEYSAMNVAAPPYSPPAEKPWTTRSRMSRAGAQTPSVAWLGSRPMQNVAPAIIRIVVASTALRPTLSPSGPSTTPPSGRNRNDTAKTESVAAVPMLGKNCAVM